VAAAHEFAQIRVCWCSQSGCTRGGEAGKKMAGAQSGAPGDGFGDLGLAGEN
jgi:hypothetical protein